MFERFTEPARRAVFIGRYEASKTPSKDIEADHLLLGILGEDKILKALLTAETIEHIREEIRTQLKARYPKMKPLPTTVDMPLSEDAKLALEYGAEESVTMGHDHIGCGHLTLGIMRLGNSVGTELLRQHGIEYGTYRLSFSVSAGVRPTSDPMELRESGGRTQWDDADELKPAAPALGAAIVRLKELLDRTVRHVEDYSYEYGEQRLKRKPWSRNEAMGHLVDWATAHHQWVARALTEVKVVASGYPLDEWVAVQNYRDLTWHDLLDLWVGLNRLIVHVLVQIPEEKLNTMCRIGIADPVPLSGLIDHYIEHCEDIVGQILARL